MSRCTEDDEAVAPRAGNPRPSKVPTQGRFHRDTSDEGPRLGQRRTVVSSRRPAAIASAVRAHGGEGEDVQRPELRTRQAVECRLGLDSLCEAIVAARAKERDEQGRIGHSSITLARLREDTLEAMVAYSDALASLAWPVPRLLHQQMELRRALLSRPTMPALTATRR